MIHKKIEIKARGMEAVGNLYTYFLDSSIEMRPDEKRPVILMCPGGGYEMTSDREAEPMAMQFLAMGYHVAVLRYSVCPVRYPAALLQVAESVLYLKEHADEYHIDPEKIVVQGCSAGGHLAANYGIAWNSPFLTKLMGMENDPERLCVAGLLLCYPVITSGEKAHEESFRNLLGEQYEEKKEELSLENQVTPDTPPTFLWHTATDETVPVENSLYFFQACLQQGVSAELHIYPVGGHGLSLANEETCRANGIGVQKECQSWIGLAQNWLEEILIKN
ncbi:alpha/beta hydrolase [Eubacterium ramulus]|uniref:alpha/beta hydrolase n=1 Tax=Eubacterium ramulus TaxID=39490 RepID=UPI00101EDADD|nr:alpha/beta hydrolase [Eubacterium ramulus]MSC77370.1 alpha/beta hydrolase fold domain-containing protein [Eubacterium ramulus]MSC93096.1 alpha/beta hydrolase fold domain-containing protein [Eubacterium ramulus]RYS98913.1 alpha/beta hydrolase [Eubacterium ramulus]